MAVVQEEIDQPSRSHRAGQSAPPQMPYRVSSEPLDVHPPRGRGPLSHVIEREVQLQHVDARLSEDPELTVSRVRVHERPHPALVEPARPCDAADLVGGRGGRDVRIEAARRRTSRGRPGSGRRCPGSAARSASIRGPSPRRRAPGWWGRGSSPSDAAPLYARALPFASAVADRRPQKYLGSSNGWPMSREPTALPSSTMRLPLAWCGNAACAMPVTSSG